MRALQNIIQEIYYEEKQQSTQIQLKKKKPKSFRFIKLPTKLMDYMAWNIWINSNFTNKYILKGPGAFLYIKICLGVSDDKRHFLFLHSGSTEPTRARGSIDISLAINYPSGPSSLLPKERKGEGEKKIIKVRLNYFPKADFFSFSFFTETRNSQMQVKKQKIFYNIKKSSVVGFGIEWDLSTEGLLTTWPSLDGWMRGWRKEINKQGSN